MSTTAVTESPPMGQAMLQAWIRDVTGRFDVSEASVHLLGEGTILVRQPGHEDVICQLKGEKA